MNPDIDVRDLVGEIRVPTLILHRTGDLDASVEGSRWLARHTPKAQLVEFDGTDHLPQVSSVGIVGAIRSFLGELPSPKASSP
jgi:pimeloyl-ACP methyl ester carboxylesterase